jgi:hypothetical protein
MGLGKLQGGRGIFDGINGIHGMDGIWEGFARRAEEGKAEGEFLMGLED